jgi:hypothetical protein
MRRSLLSCLTRLTIFVVFAGVSALAFARQTTINGAEHPELIPDQAAASAIFSVHSMFATSADQVNTEKHHAKLNLSPADQVTYDAAMQSFFNRINSHKEAVLTITQSTLDSLKATLSADGAAKLTAFIKSEKRHMQHDIGIGGPQ